PVATGDAIHVAAGGTATALFPSGTSVLANDTDADLPGDTLTVAVGTGPAHASSFTLNPDGTFSYTHDGTESFSDSFTYTVFDGVQISRASRMAIAITPVNDNTPVD